MGHTPSYTPTTPTNESLDLLKEFAESRNPDTLIKAYEEFRKRKGHFSPPFISLLLKAFRRKKHSKRENPEFEYETKLNLEIETKGTEPRPIDYLSNISKRIPYSQGFLSNQDCLMRNSNHSFFIGEREETVIMTSGNEKETKIKKKSLESISSNNQIMKRKDKVIVATSTQEVILAIQEAMNKGQRYIGDINRRRARNDFLSCDSGRIYTLFFDLCEVKKLNQPIEMRRQIEVEYMSYIKGFRGFEDSEDQITEELLRLTSITRRAIEGKIIERQRITSAKPTTEKKSDFLLK